VSDRRQGGYVLVGFALLTLPLLAFAALVIDIGAAGTTQARMETAAEAAALEGPAGWRAATDPAWCEGVAAPCDPADRFDAWDAARRARASVRVGALFAAGDVGDPRVGPIGTVGLATDPTLSDPSLSTLVVAPAAPPSGPPVGPGDPRLEAADPLARNLGDAASGDVVAGDFTGPTLDRVTSCADPGVLEAYGENCLYQRTDFTPGAEGAETRRAFLARLRATGEATEAGVSAPDETLSVLFGRLADTGLRQNGVAVRATAIADARPALAAGRPTGALPGAAGVAFDLGWWQGIPAEQAGAPEPIALTVVGASIFQGAAEVGRVLGAPRAVFVGEPVATAGALGDAAGEAFVPLYRFVPSAGGERVVAFGRAVVTATVGSPDVVVRKWPSAVAGANVSAVATAGLRGLAAEVVSDLFQEYRGGTCDSGDPVGRVCAPVLVR